MPNARLLEAIRTNTYIETELDLTNERFSDAQMAELVAALEMNTHIKSLEMLNCAIRSTTARILAANTTLTALDVSCNRIGPEGVEALAANTTLRTLKVAETKMGPEGVRALAANTTLTTLDVSGNEIGLAGVKALAANTTLRTLKMAKTKMGPEGVEALAANTTLTTLDVSFNEIDPKGIQAFLANRTLTTLGWRQRSMTPVLMEQQVDAMLKRNREFVTTNTANFAVLLTAARVADGTGLEEIVHSIVPLAGLIRDFAGFASSTPHAGAERLLDTQAFANLVGEHAVV